MGKRILPLLVSIAVVMTSLAVLQDVAARASDTKKSLAKSLLTDNENGTPVLDLNGPDPNYDYATTFTENEGPKPIVAGSMTISDTDGTTIRSAAITLTNRLDGYDEFLEINTENTSLTANYDPDSGVLQLGSTDTISNYQKALSSITYNNLSDSPAATDRLIFFRVFDGINQSNEAQSTVTVESVNDLPLIDLNGIWVPGNNVTVQFDESNWGGKAVPISNGLEVQDPDDRSLITATVTLENRPDGQSEYLTANTEGTDIAAVFEQDSGQLQLTGMETLINYVHVLRTVTYANSRTRPNSMDRLAKFTVQDHAGKSNIATSRIVVIPKLILLPIVANVMSAVPESDESNDTCLQAYPLGNNVPYEFQAEDENDWYSFSINSTSNVTVELTEYAPEEGQILVAEGQCDALVRIGHNGNPSTNKIIELDNLAAGRYYIWLITDNVRISGEPYKYNLLVKVQ